MFTEAAPRFVAVLPWLLLAFSREDALNRSNYRSGETATVDGAVQGGASSNAESPLLIAGR